jgi:hypothetical protein
MKTSDRAMREEDYAFARTRVPNRKHWGRLERGYEVATHFAQVIASRSRNQAPDDLKREFSENAERWKDETGHLSSLTKAISHPSYLRIIGLAKYSVDHQLEKLLLQELRAEPDHWFAALTAITGEDPVRPDDNFDRAVARWIEWGRTKGII